MAPKHKTLPQSKLALPESTMTRMKNRKAEFQRGSRVDRIKLRNDCTKLTMSEYNIPLTDEIAYTYYHTVSTFLR